MSTHERRAIAQADDSQKRGVQRERRDRNLHIVLSSSPCSAVQERGVQREPLGRTTGLGVY